MIFDCFTFFNELDVLELRLHELDSVVDRFVLVEATRTFSGRPKPLVFEANKERFKRFLPRIEHVVVRDLPDESASPWAREAAQRDAILRGLKTAIPEDVILISDVDEIPRASCVRQFVQARGQAASFYMPTFYYKLNVKNVRGEVFQPLTVAVRRAILKTPQETRLWRFGLPGIPDAGWHFSYLGDEDAIRTQDRGLLTPGVQYSRSQGPDRPARRARRGLVRACELRMECRADRRELPELGAGESRSIRVPRGATAGLTTTFNDARGACSARGGAWD